MADSARLRQTLSGLTTTNPEHSVVLLIDAVLSQGGFQFAQQELLAALHGWKDGPLQIQYARGSLELTLLLMIVDGSLLFDFVQGEGAEPDFAELEVRKYVQEVDPAQLDRRFTLEAFSLCAIIADKLQGRVGGGSRAPPPTRAHHPAANAATKNAAPAAAEARAEAGGPAPSLLIATHGPGSGRNPLAYGDADLNPAGLHPTHMPFPGGALPGPGGMMLGPGHPLFDMRVSGPRPGGLHDIRGVPPGARFDPIGPFGARPGPGRNPGRLGFDGEPDPDHLPPPGYGDQFM